MSPIYLNWIWQSVFIFNVTMSDHITVSPGMEMRAKRVP